MRYRELAPGIDVSEIGFRLYVSCPDPSNGRGVGAPRAAGEPTVHLRSVRDGEPESHEAR